MSKGSRLVFIFAAIAVLVLLYFYSRIMLFSPKEELRRTCEVERGPILDRNGNILAIQSKAFRVSVRKQDLDEENADEVIGKLAEVLDLNKGALRKKYKASGDYVLFARRVPFDKGERIRAMKASGELPYAVRLDSDFLRTYPEKELASHLVGFAGDGNIGRSGIEQEMDKYLNPGNDPDINSDVVYGNQVFLTIDADIQKFAQQASMEIMEKFAPREGLVTLVLDAKTGEVLAYVCMPEVDLNKYFEYSSDDPDLMNKPVAYRYEPGSVFKVFSLSSFLELGGITPTTKFYCSGLNCYTRKSGREIVKIKCTGNHKSIDIGDIIKYSCNAACYASDTVSDKDFYDMIVKFGFGRRTEVELHGEIDGLVHNYENWSARSKPTVTIGQEIGVSAMQIVQAATAIANHGVMLAPHVVKKVLDATGNVISETGRKEVGRVVSGEVADEMLLMMERATDGGTARRHGVDGVRLSAKTGTAEVSGEKLKGYSSTDYTASCLLIFPTDDPQYIIYNVTFSPRSSVTTGAGISVPAVGKIANSIISYKGIPRKGDAVVASDAVARSDSDEKDYTVIDTIPDFSGASKAHLLPLFKDGRFKVSIKGSGWVYSQNPAPGTPVKSGMKLEFELR